MKIYQLGTTCLVALIVLSISSTSRADISIDFSDDGTDTTVFLSGSLDITTLGAPSQSGANQPTSLVWGATGAVSFGGSMVDRYEGVTMTPADGTPAFGTAGFVGGGASVVPVFGDAFQFNATSGRLELPDGYVSGTELNATMTFENFTVDDFGITPSSYSLLGGQTINIGTVVPEPSVVGLLGMGLIGCVFRRRRK